MGKPYVLNLLPHWYLNNDYENFVSGKKGDGSDMVADVYFIDENSALMRDWGPPFEFLNLKIFRGKLEGQDCFLEYLSQYIKENVESFDWLISLFCKFRAEAESKKINNHFETFYDAL